MNRIKEINSALSQKDIDALIVTKLPNVRYLSGFSGSAGFLLISPQSSYFISDFRYKIQASLEIRKPFKTIIGTQGSFEIVKDLASKFSFNKIGFEAGSMVYSQFLSLKTILKGATLVPTDGLIEEFTSVKTAEEIDNISSAVKITDKVFSKLLEIIKPGIREKEIAAELTYLHRQLGASGNSFEPIVASGPNGAFPHAQPTDRKIKSGDLVTLDFGCVYNGFCSDMTRTIGVGKISPESRKIYDTVLIAQKKAVDSVIAGKRASEVDSVARDYIRDNGYGEYFGHGLGHGLGIEVHENPRLNQISKAVLKINNVVTIEPGIYIEGIGGVRIEDDVVVSKDGCKVLNKSSKELIIL